MTVCSQSKIGPFSFIVLLSISLSPGWMEVAEYRKMYSRLCIQLSKELYCYHYRYATTRYLIKLNDILLSMVHMSTLILSLAAAAASAAAATPATTTTCPAAAVDIVAAVVDTSERKSPKRVTRWPK